MDNKSKIEQLRAIIDKELRPVIIHDYVLWGLPYHVNIGDILIWQGELDFLSTLPYKCLGVCPYNGYPKVNGSSSLKKDIIILIHGGGYFGDTWRDGWEHVLKAVTHYPKNKIVFLPNTIYYSDDSYLQKDIETINALTNLTICARDRVSYEYAKQHFNSQVLLIPDMAFYIHLPSITQWIQPPTGKILHLRRLDKEAATYCEIDDSSLVDVRDWPTLEPDFKKPSFEFYRQVIRFRKNLPRRIPWTKVFICPIADYILYKWFRPEIIKIGVRFLSQYNQIYSTRLHVVILSLILNKEVISEDNSYGKLSSFYDTWLVDADNVTIKHKKHD